MYVVRLWGLLESGLNLTDIKKPRSMVLSLMSGKTVISCVIISVLFGMTNPESVMNLTVII